MAKLIQLPAVGCIYYVNGRCWYAERLNPGYAEKHRCPVLARWADKLGDFQHRADVMGLPHDRIGPAWEARLEAMLPQIRRCENFVEGEGIWECAHAHDLLCSAAMPICPGRCRHYRIEAETDHSVEE